MWIFNLGERKVSFIETPGHTPGSICLFDEKANISLWEIWLAKKEFC